MREETQVAPEIAAKEDLETLRRARKLLSDANHWCQRWYSAQRESWNGVAALGAATMLNADTHCLIGAVIKARGLYDVHGEYEVVGQDLDPLLGRARARLCTAINEGVESHTVSVVEDWNDTAGRTHAEVLEVLDRAIEHAQSEVDDE